MCDLLIFSVDKREKGIGLLHSQHQAPSLAHILQWVKNLGVAENDACVHSNHLPYGHALGKKKIFPFYVPNPHGLFFQILKEITKIKWYFLASGAGNMGQKGKKLIPNNFFYLSTTLKGI
jgi:hypothetical protein